MLDASDRIAVALQVLRRQHHVDAEAVASILLDTHPRDVVQRAMERGIGMVCSAETCAAWELIEEPRREAARALLVAEQMDDLLR
jgi:hypothetical protein